MKCYKYKIKRMVMIISYTQTKVLLELSVLVI